MKINVNEISGMKSRKAKPRDPHHSNVTQLHYCLVVKKPPNWQECFSEDDNEVTANVAGFFPPQTFALCEGHLNYKHSTCNFFPGASHLLILALQKNKGKTIFCLYFLWET